MESMVFKYKHHYQQQIQHFNTRNSSGSSMNQNSNNNCGISSHNNNNNNNNQNSIFILNTAATNNILPNNPQLYYSDLNDNNAVSSSSSSCAPSTHSAASSSVWSSASSTMCSPAAHALQKLFNCSSSSFKFNHSYNGGIESKSLKSKSEILKKKSKFWQYLEGEDNDKNNQRGIDDGEVNEKKLLAKGFKFKSNNWSKSIDSQNQNQQDLSELLEYSCSLCDNCRCVDCQIGYFDCENSDDSNSEYSFQLSAYEEDEDLEQSDCERQRELNSSSEVHNNLQTSCNDCCTENVQDPHCKPKLEIGFDLSLNNPINCCVSKQTKCSKIECCQQCLVENIQAAAKDETKYQNLIATRDH